VNKKKQTSKKEIKVNETKNDGIQVHFGNVKIVELKLLEAISKNSAEILKVLRDILEKAEK
jgi:hypothetical protein